MKKAKILGIIIVTSLLSACGHQESHYFQGYIDTDLIYVASSQSGTLTKLFVHRGQSITKEQALFDLDANPQNAELNQAEATLEEAKATLKNLQLGARPTLLKTLQEQVVSAKAKVKLSHAQLQRSEKLYKRHAIDKNSLEIAQANFDEAKALLKQYQANVAENKLGARRNLINAQEAAVRTAAANVRASKWALQQKSVSAAIQAIVFDTYYRVGEFVNPGAPVLSLYTPQTLNVIFYIPEPKLSKIKLGQTVFLHCDSCNSTMQAKISYISPQAEYTPPLIYSQDNNSKLVFEVKAQLQGDAMQVMHPGEPVAVALSSAMAASTGQSKTGFIEHAKKLWHKVTGHGKS